MSTEPGTAGATRTLRVLSWNICELRGDLVALVDAVRDLDADVLLIQEAPRLVLPQLRLDWFASAVDRRILVGGRFGRGLAILGTESIERQVIRRGMEPVRQRLSDANSTYPRGIAAVRLSLGGGHELVVSCIHLALQLDNRLAHVTRVRERIVGAGAPVIIGGDLNETSDGQARTLLSTVVRDTADDAEFTFPASRPRSQIDAICASEGVEVLSCGRVLRTATVEPERLAMASDHLPMLLEARIPAF